MESVLGLEKLISGFEKPAFQSWPLWLTSHLWLGCWEVEQSTSGYTGPLVKQVNLHPQMWKPQLPFGLFARGGVWLLTCMLLRCVAGDMP